MTNVVSIAVGFVLTTLVGGWWAARLQQRSWEHQNDLRLKEDELKQAATVSQEVSRLLNKRLYRMRRVHWAIAGLQSGGVSSEALDVHLGEYNNVLYEWNDRLNVNLALVGSYFGPAAREYLYFLYERFRAVGQQLENAVRTVRSGNDVSAALEKLDPEFEGWKAGSLNQRVYLLGLAMMSQLREGQVGRSAPDKLTVPELRVQEPKRDG